VDVEEILAALAEQHVELDRLITGRSEAEWRTPSPCEGWDAADVLLHLVQTDRLAVASLDGTFAAVMGDFARSLDGAADVTPSVDAAADWQVAQERGAPGAVIAAQWAEQTAVMREMFAAADPSERVPWVAGTLSVRTLATTRLAECWIHTTDIAAAFGTEVAPTDRLRYVARLAWRTLPYAFTRAGRAAPGPVAFELTGPDGDDWVFTPEVPATTTVRGSGADLCRVAGRRLDPAAADLTADGPDAPAVLQLVRTYA
jgi:uncharacterized protein (TIGR03084 family)